MHRVSPFLLAAVILATPRAAHAQAAAAEALFDQGRTALAAGDLETACARFRASDQIEPAAGTRANLAECEERRGRIATAWELYKSAVAKLAPADSRVPVLKERIAKLELMLPKLVLTLSAGASKNTVVREGEATIGVAASYGVPLPLDPGAHHLVVMAPGREPKAVDVTLVEAKTITVVVDASETRAPDASLLAPRQDALPIVEGRSVAPWIVGGVGMAGLTIGAVTGALVLGNKSTVSANCTNGPPPTCGNQTGLNAASAVRALGPVTTVALLIGAAGVTAGGVWLGVRGSENKPSVQVGVTPGLAGAAWRVGGSW